MRCVYSCFLTTGAVLFSPRLTGQWVQSTNAEAWKYHVQALARIIESRGPHAFKQANERRLFLQARSVIVSSSFVSFHSTDQISWSWHSKTGKGRFLPKIPGKLSLGLTLPIQNRTSTDSSTLFCVCLV